MHQPAPQKMYVPQAITIKEETFKTDRWKIHVPLAAHFQDLWTSTQMSTRALPRPAQPSDGFVKQFGKEEAFDLPQNQKYIRQLYCLHCCMSVRRRQSTNVMLNSSIASTWTASESYWRSRGVTKSLTSKSSLELFYPVTTLCSREPRSAGLATLSECPAHVFPKDCSMVNLAEGTRSLGGQKKRYKDLVLSQSVPERVWYKYRKHW